MTSFGIWGLIPPVLTITLAFITKDVMVSLFLGIFSGAIIVAGGNPLVAVINLTDMIAGSLNDGWNIRIFLFCALLGGLVGMLSKTGSAHAFGRWAADKLHTSKTSLLMTWFCGLLIFIDDYFNSLAVGTVMRPYLLPENRIPPWNEGLIIAVRLGVELADAVEHLLAAAADGVVGRALIAGDVGDLPAFAQVPIEFLLGRGKVRDERSHPV